MVCNPEFIIQRLLCLQLPWLLGRDPSPTIQNQLGGLGIGAALGFALQLHDSMIQMIGGFCLLIKLCYLTRMYLQLTAGEHLHGLHILNRASI